MMEMVKKLLFWTLVAFVIYAVFRYPSLAADAVSSVWSFFVHLFDSLVRFFNGILTG
jgi:hypothetical protein